MLRGRQADTHRLHSSGCPRLIEMCPEPMAAASDDLDTVAETNRGRADPEILGRGGGQGMRQHSDEYRSAALQYKQTAQASCRQRARLSRFA